MSLQSELATLLSAGSSLLESAPPNPRSELKTVLLARLSQYYTILDVSDKSPDLIYEDVEKIELETAREAQHVVERVQLILRADEQTAGNSERTSTEQISEEPPPLLGTRDLAHLRTLLSMIFRWGIDPLLAQLAATWSTPKPSRFTPTIIDLTNTPDIYNLLSSLTSRFVALLFPDGLQGTIPQTLITSTILIRHIANLLKPCIALGWIPKSLASDAIPTAHELRPFVSRLLGMCVRHRLHNVFGTVGSISFLCSLPPSQTISDLGAILSSTPTPVLHIRKACSALLSRQLLRPEGVRGLCAAVFGEQESAEDAPLEKFDHVARVLSTVPAGMHAEEYFTIITPRIVALISNNSPPMYRRAASFTLSRMLMPAAEHPHHTLVSSIVLPILHDPLFYLTVDIPDIIAKRTETLASTFSEAPSSPTAAISTLLLLLLNTDPSPTFISSVLSPVITTLYSLFYHLQQTRASDPVLRESVSGLLTTWGRVVDRREGLSVLNTILRGDRIGWQVNVAGEVTRVEWSGHPMKLSLLTPDDLRQQEESEDIDLDIFDLYPNPTHLVQYLKSLDRSDITSELFVQLLEAYQKTKGVNDADPLRVMLYLQLIIQMQTQLAGNASSNILNKPEHILLFVKHALEPSKVGQPGKSRDPSKSTQGLTLEDLRIVPEEDDNDTSLRDSDSDDEETAPGAPDIEMTETAVNLLLATLEANPSLSARSAPVLNHIFELLEPLANHESQSMVRLAREARIVMTARLASTSTVWPSSRTTSEEHPQDIYQKALKLLEDPILPVRAHGLLLLRQLVSSKPSSPDEQGIDRALSPAILSIFMQSIQDEDSYIFLNAVQGLSAMVDSFGKDVLTVLVGTYAKGLDGISGTMLTQQDIDTRTRVGEALGQVIRRCGGALGIYVDIIVPPLFKLLRSKYAPAVLRSSSISLLTECIKTNSIALSSYVDDLADGMVDLLQVEKPDADEEQQTVDSNPTSISTKYPSLRRAALHFLTLLIRSIIEHVYSDGIQQHTVSGAFMKRAKITLSYVASTDPDRLVKVMARETMEQLEQLNSALLGL